MGVPASSHFLPKLAFTPSAHYALIKCFAFAERGLNPRCGCPSLSGRSLTGGTLDFLLNEEQLHLKKSVREFAEREIAPNVTKWDEAGEFPLATIKELGKLGLLGTVFPTVV